MRKLLVDGNSEVQSRFIPTNKNHIASNFFDDLGFSRLSSNTEEAVSYSLQLSEVKSSHLSLMEVEFES